jgi:hypothetical protein
MALLGRKGIIYPGVGIDCAEMGRAGSLPAFDRPVRFKEREKS